MLETLIVGLVCGLLPLIAGFWVECRRLGLFGFCACTVVGFLLGGGAAIVVALLFTVIMNIVIKWES